MAAGTTFHLIRHASYDLLGQVLAGRSPGHSLNDAGRVEAERLSQALAHWPIAALVSSPLERARETAGVIARRLRLDVIIEPDLDEIDFGAWTGWRFDVLHAAREWQVFNQLRSAAQIPDGETMLQAQARAVTAIMRLRVRWGASELAVVSHGDVVKAVLAHFIGMPIDLMRRIEIAPASRSVLRVREMDVSVDGINLPPGT